MRNRESCLLAGMQGDDGADWYRPRGGASTQVMMRSLKRLSVLVFAGTALMLVFGAGSALAQPCWKKLIDDWYDGRIDGTYSYACYRAAIKNAPEDIRQYSDLPSQLNRLLQSAHLVKKGGQTYVASGSGGRSGGPISSRQDQSHNDQSQLPSAARRDPPDPPGPIPKAINSIGPSKPDSFPIPLIALGSLAVLLIASGTAGLVAKRIRMRRAPP
jgi:hypothetical protein